MFDENLKTVENCPTKYDREKCTCIILMFNICTFRKLMNVKFLFCFKCLQGA